MTNQTGRKQKENSAEYAWEGKYRKGINIKEEKRTVDSPNLNFVMKSQEGVKSERGERDERVCRDERCL